MSDASTDAQTARRLAGDLEDAVTEIVEERLKTVNTTCPGIIKAFDRQRLTVTVQPVHQRLWIQDDDTVKALDVPLCTDVPVQFPGGGTCILTFDLQSGDECIVVFSQRCIDEWFQNGGTQPPGESTPGGHRFHDLSDAMAIPVVWSQARAPFVNGGVSSGGAELRTLDGTVIVRVDESGVFVGGVAGADATIKATNYLALEGTAFAALATFVASGAVTALAPAQAAAVATALGNYAAALASFPTTLAKVL